MKRTLQRHLIIVFIALTLCPLLLVSVFFSYLSFESTKGEALKHEQVVAKRVSSEVKLFIGCLSTELHFVADDLNFFNKDLKQKKQIIDALMSHDNLFNQLAVLNKRGEEELKISLINLVNETDLTNRKNEDVFLIPSKTKKIYYSSIWIDEITGEPLLNVAVPVLNLQNGDVDSIIVAQVLFKRIWETLADLQIRIGEDIYIVDSQERLIAHRNPSLVLKKTNFKLPESDGYHTGLNSTEAAIAVDKILFGSQVFYVVAEIEKKEALKLAYKTIWAGAIFIGVVLLIAFFVALYTARRVGRPLSKMAEIAIEIRDGALDTRAPSSEYKELSNLSSAFNSMTDQLHKSLENLHNEITEREKAESDLLFTKFAVDHSADAAFWIGRNGFFDYVNEASCRKLGYSREELLTMSVQDVDPNFPSEAWPTHWEEIKTKGSFLFETQHLTKNGDLIPVEVTVNFMKFKDMEYNCAFVRDISGRKKAEEERVKMADHLQQAQKMEAIGTLAGGIAHDFNNILSAIIGYTELAKVKLQGEGEIAGMLEEVLKAGDRAKGLVQQILAFSRKAAEDQVPLQIHLIVKEALKLLRSSIPTTIEIRENIDSSGGIVLADPTKIHQIMMNLCTNAYHAMRETGGIITVDLSQVSVTKNDALVIGRQLAPGNFMKLMVSDTGHGMDQTTMERIFEPYFTTKGHGEGTGLGLAMVHGIVKSYGGHISTSSELGQGTTFQVYLPVAATLPTSQTKNNVYDPMPHGNERILLVDDEEAIVKMAQNMLEGLGYHVTATTNSEEAVKIYCSQPENFDLVITDMTMPNMTGAELSQKILEKSSGIPIILCTGYSELINGEKAKAIGIREYVSKPISQRDLAKVVRKVMDAS